MLLNSSTIKIRYNESSDYIQCYYNYSNSWVNYVFAGLQKLKALLSGVADTGCVISGTGYSYNSGGYIAITSGGGTFTNYILVGSIDLSKYKYLYYHIKTSAAGEVTGYIDISSYSSYKYIGVKYLTDASHNECQVLVGTPSSSYVSIKQIHSTSASCSYTYVYDLWLSSIQS